MRLHNKIVVITGGATGLKTKLMGFGGTTAHLFAKEGAKVIITDINEDLGIQTAEEIKKNGGDSSFMYLDVTDEKGWIDLVSNIKKKYSTIDILVHSAGFTKRTTIHETTVESWDAHMDIHVKGAFLGIKHVSPIMQNNKKGSIVLISSIMGLVGSASSTPYHAAKGAIHTFTKAAAIQLAKDNVRVNCISPGFVLTPMTEDLFTDNKILKSRLSSVPMERLGNPIEIANAILYLASDESSFVTGIDLVIDGGYTAQ